MNADGSNVHRLTNLRWVSGYPAWSPDGKTIAFMSTAGGDHAHNEIWTIPAAGGKPQQVTTSTTDAIQPSWAPDGALSFSVDGAIWIERERKIDAAHSGQGERVRAPVEPSPGEVGSARHGDGRPSRHARHQGARVRYLRDRLREQGVDVVVVDAGVFEPQIEADVANAEVAAAAGADVAALAKAGDRGAAVDAMGRGAAEVVRAPARGRAARRDPLRRRLRQLVDRGAGDARAARRRAEADRLDTGLGDTRPYVGASDVAMTYSVVDIAGLNRISERILANAAGAIAGDGEGAGGGAARAAR